MPSLKDRDDIVVNLKFDLRSPTFGSPTSQLIRESIEMASYADMRGIDSISLSEHHGSPDGYLPSPLVLAASVAAVTQRCRLRLSALIAPLYDPVRLAEDLAVLDNISSGRITVVLAAGYVPQEFAMFGKSIRNRAQDVETTVDILRKAWTGRSFEYRGVEILVTPRPLQPSIPIYLGGSTPAAARRAARIADGFVTHREELYRIYEESAVALGHAPEPFEAPGPGFVHITRDPAGDWERIGPHALHETNAYGEWAQAAGLVSTYSKVASLSELKRLGSYAVVTPDECIALAREHGRLTLHPLMGGLDPALGWSSLRLFCEEVLPGIRP